MTLVVDTESPQALAGRVSRVTILHPEVSCRGDDEEHEGSHTAQCAPTCQCVQHQGVTWDSTVLLLAGGSA